MRAGRREHAAHEPLISRAMLADVALTGLSFAADGTQKDGRKEVAMVAVKMAGMMFALAASLAAGAAGARAAEITAANPAAIKAAIAAAKPGDTVVIKAGEYDMGQRVNLVGGGLKGKPITIRSGALAYEVLHILEHHRIDDLVVVDATNKPVGIVDTQDLARFRLV